MLVPWLHSVSMSGAAECAQVDVTHGQTVFFEHAAEENDGVREPVKTPGVSVHLLDAREQRLELSVSDLATISPLGRLEGPVALDTVEVIRGQ